MHALVEVDVTDARRAIREYRARTREPLSFTGFIVGCMGTAIAEHPGIEDIPGVTVEGVVGDDALHGIVVVGGDGARRTIDIERLVAKVGYSAATELVAGQLVLDETGAIVTDRDLATSVAGVFAAGDVVSGAYARVATAMGDGVRAAASILRYLSA
jgi:thioredoxin reductase (NADPH)